jgi:hypothetical protein
MTERAERFIKWMDDHSGIAPVDRDRRICQRCEQRYPPNVNYCPEDGTMLTWDATRAWELAQIEAAMAWAMREK